MQNFELINMKCALKYKKSTSKKKKKIENSSIDTDEPKNKRIRLNNVEKRILRKRVENLSVVNDEPKKQSFLLKSDVEKKG